MRNPHAGDADRSAIWEMLVTRDIEAYAAADWGMVEGDFLANQFFGVSGSFDPDCDRWMPTFPSLDTYRDEWLNQAAQTAQTADRDRLVEAVHALTTLEQIDIAGDFAVAHKKFDGDIPMADGTRSKPMLWQTLYLCRKTAEGWKIAGFFGYLPNPKPH